MVNSQSYAQQLSVDQAFEMLHNADVDAKVVWNAKYECCSLHVIADEGIFRIFTIFDGLIEEEEDQPTFRDMLSMFSKPRPPLTLVK